MSETAATGHDDDERFADYSEKMNMDDPKAADHGLRLDDYMANGLTEEGYKYLLKEADTGEVAFRYNLGLLNGLFRMPDPYYRIIPYKEIRDFLYIPVDILSPNYTQLFKHRSQRIPNLFTLRPGYQVHTFKSDLCANNLHNAIYQTNTIEGVILTNPDIQILLNAFKFYPWDENILKCFPTGKKTKFNEITRGLISLGYSESGKLITRVPIKCLLLWKLLIRKYPSAVTSAELASLMTDKDTFPVDPTDGSYQTSKSRLVAELNYNIKIVSEGIYELDTIIEKGGRRNAVFIKASL